MGLSSVGSCNGLIACSYNGTGCFVLFNPTTRQVRHIPTLPRSYIPEPIVGDIHIRAPFPVRGSGFGYDSHFDDYKIVSVNSVRSHKNSVRVEIFNLKCNSWRTIDDLNCSDYFCGQGVFINGILHWLNTNEQKTNENECSLVRFDLVEERFLDTMKLPSQIEYDYLRLMPLDEHLCVSFVVWDSGINFLVWKMTDYGVMDSWTKIYQFSNGNLLHSPVTLQFVTKTGHVVFATNDYCLIIYNHPKDEKIEVKEILTPKQRRDAERDPRRDATMLQCIVFVESLVSPHNNRRLRSPNMCSQQPNSQTY